MTAKEFLIKNRKIENNDEEMLIEFAKFHVREALKQASENADLFWGESGESYNFIDKDTILNAYDINNIK